MSEDEAQRLESITVVVDELEAVLRRMALWDEEVPARAQLASTRPFAYDTLAFHQWLQWQLIPRMRRILDGEGDLPTRSAIYPYAEECLTRVDADPTELLFLIGHFDALIAGGEPPAPAH